MTHYLLVYEAAPGYFDRRAEFRDEHLALAWAAHGRGELVIGGALPERDGGAMIVFRGESPAVAEAFAQADPYVRHGLVARWSIREWATVVGASAATPVYPAGHGRGRHYATARGAFDVKMSPLASDDAADGTPLGRLALDKVFRGDLEATSRGEMMTAVTPVKGSAGYVALERVAGRLHGKTGTFVLQHSGTMAAGAQSLSVTVVPGSGTGQLQGIEGTLAIVIEGKAHSYVFDYALPAPERS